MTGSSAPSPPIGAGRPSLAERVPTEPSAEAMLDAFLGWTTDLGLELYPAQEEAVLEIMSGRHVILATPTGSGKSLVATAMHFRGLCRGDRSFYTSPIKALVSEKFFALCQDFGAESVGMLTGDASINRDAPIVCCTAEVLANQALREGAAAPVDHVCMDEFHFYADPDRGPAWQIPLLVLPRAAFLLMSATLGDTTTIEAGLRAATGREVARVTSSERPVPLTFEYSTEPLHLTLHELVRKGRAPVYVVNFSQREAAEQAQSLMSVDFSDKEDKRVIAGALRGFRFDSPYGGTIERYLRHGVGLHHAGLLPKYRLLTERLAQQGLLKVISGTDTLGVGVNVPIRTVVFTKLCKFDGERTRILSVRELKQIAGRAGRKGFDDAGWVVAQDPEHVIENRRLAQSGKKKIVKRKPPQRGFVPWNRGTFERLVQGDPEPLQSVFRVDTSMMIHLLQRGGGRGGGYRALLDLIDRCHEHPGSKRHLRRDAARLFRALRRARLVELVPGAGAPVVAVAEGLQRDFSLNHTLSLYLVFALGRLDQRRESYPLDILTLVEAILEHPYAILARQVSEAKGRLVAELKAQGVPYEERMEALEKVTYPKPNAEWIYNTFDRFAERHPWLAHEHIRPKSVARDMYERYASFADYVRELGLERMEGVLLRYLSQAYKTLEQNVPESFKTDEVVDLAAWLRVLVARVDSSLLQEWERMMEAPPEVQAPEELASRRPPDPTRDGKAFAARLRAEMHRLVKALAEGDFEEAACCVRPPSPDEPGLEPWTAERFEAALAGFLGTYERVVFDHRARLTDKTLIEAAGRRRWEISQVLCDPAGDDFWCARGVVDLSDEAPVTDDPLITLVDIGT